MTLTARQIEAAKPQNKAYKIAAGGGLYLYVAPTGLRSWRANYQQDGKQKTRTYGRYPDMTLSQARIAHGTAKEGVPKPEAPPAVCPTFEVMAKAWLKVKLPGLSNPKHQGQVASTLERFVYPTIGSKPIDTIRRAELVEVVQVAQQGGRVETAHRVAGRITAVFNHAQDIGILESHGAAGLVRVLQSRKVRKPMASIPTDQTGELLRLIDTYEETVTRLGLHLLALTFVRVGELRAMRWDELHEDSAVWVVPETRMKLGLPHVVPLSRQAQALLEQLRLLTGGPN
jgi:integrase